MKDKIQGVMQKIIDPELQLDIWNLGLIYEIKEEGGKVHITMTLTTPACPYGPALLEEVKQKTAELDGVKEVDVEVTFSPPWSPEKMSEEARIGLGM